jgi:dicarboxylate/amino acid:cation (Na+ or H+) symporter, DAACS family
MAAKSLPLHTKIFIGLFTGLVLGLLANLILPGDSTVKWVVDNIAYPAGQIFLRMIFMLIIPLIFTAIVLGVSDFRDMGKIGRVGIKVLVFTVVITSISVLIGIILVNMLSPGTGISQESRELLISHLQGNRVVTGIITTAQESKSFIQVLLDFIPRNPFAEIVFYLDPNYRGGGLIAFMFFSVVFGIALAVSSESRTEGLTKTLQGIYDVIMKMIDFAMKLAPIGVAGLIFPRQASLVSR